LINEVVLEGIVVREPWKFMDDLFFRLVIYRDSDLPAKKLDLERDAGDYINVRVNGGANGLIHIRRGMRLRVHGFIQSRDYRESLEEFISKARKSKSCADLAVDIKACDLMQNQVLIDRNVVEAVARRIIVLDAASPREKKTRSIGRVTTGRPAETENGSSEKVSASEENNTTAD
jgi:homospermidine synthase